MLEPWAAISERLRRNFKLMHYQRLAYFLIKVRLSYCFPFGPSTVMSILRVLPSGESTHLRVA